jgi:hypothetical protein
MISLRRKSCHELPEPFLGGIQNRIAVADQESIEVEGKEATRALAQARGIVDDFIRQELAASRRVADDGVSDQ